MWAGIQMNRTMDPNPGGAGAVVDRQDEGDLLLRHLAGDRAAFGELVAAYRAPVFSYLARCGVAEADRDDLFQEVFIRTHRAARTWDSGRPFHPWFFTIVCNAVRNHLRKRRVRRLVFTEPREEAPPEPAAPEADGERRAAARQTVRRLEEEIRRLPLKQREVVLLAAVQKRPLKEVAEILDLNLNTVKTHLRRGRLALAQALEEGEHPREERS
jgi:RNA polymerase sigma-70 factor (ECF subfamily)